MHQSQLSRRSLLQVSATIGAVSLAVPAALHASTLARPLAAPTPAATATSPILAAARAGLQRAGARVAHLDVVAVADFAQPSSHPRFHLVDTASGRITSLLVAHGRGSDPSHCGWLSRFSNAAGSDCTSEGDFLTAADYVGKHGRSIRLSGLEATNSNAESRGIVVHNAPYVSAQMVRDHGVLGRSEGCFALSAADLPQVLQRMGPGRLLVSTKL
ncbi:MAG TPA: murein L,D-transpeptidase catalytic domain family protein [Caulobacteraceae bacterium]|nr:murein L,D-transpeptidase catalytic domain family protein [Caulobacteraceae bacterium]